MATAQKHYTTALTRALADKADHRKAKRFHNIMRASVRAAKGEYGPSTPAQRNQTFRIIMRTIARTSK